MTLKVEYRCTGCSKLIMQRDLRRVHYRGDNIRWQATCPRCKAEYIEPPTILMHTKTGAYSRPVIENEDGEDVRNVNWENSMHTFVQSIIDEARKEREKEDG